MKAVILAAGKGKRMLPLTLEKPKPLLEVAGKPLLVRIWELLPREIEEVILVVGYRRDMMRAYFGDEFLGKRVRYIEQKEQKGTAHALFLCREYLKGERFLFMMADDLYDKETIAQCVLGGLVMLVSKVDDPSRFGVVAVDEEGNIRSFEEKPERPQSNLASTGAFVLDDRVFGYELERHERFGEYFLTPLIEKLAIEHGMKIKKASTWIPIATPEDLTNAGKRFL